MESFHLHIKQLLGFLKIIAAAKQNKKRKLGLLSHLNSTMPKNGFHQLWSKSHIFAARQHTSILLSHLYPQPCLWRHFLKHPDTVKVFIYSKFGTIYKY